MIDTGASTSLGEVAYYKMAPEIFVCYYGSFSLIGHFNLIFCFSGPIDPTFRDIFVSFRVRGRVLLTSEHAK